MEQAAILFRAVPRGFCGGVKRAIALVEQALRDFGAPVYVYHQIVHNQHVVAGMKSRGVVFIEKLEEIANRERPLVISAHGAARKIYEQAESLGLKVIDATCPLVEKVHRHISKLDGEGFEIIVIGKATHPEILGTVGQLNNQTHVHLVNSPTEAQNLQLPENKPAGVVTQTTLARDEVAEISKILEEKFPQLKAVGYGDICYATTNRQKAAAEIAKAAEAVIVIGSQNSSNSRQLQKIALQNGAAEAWLIDDAGELPWKSLQKYRRSA